MAVSETSFFADATLYRRRGWSNAAYSTWRDGYQDRRTFSRKSGAAMGKEFVYCRYHRYRTGPQSLIITSNIHTYTEYPFIPVVHSYR